MPETRLIPMLQPTRRNIDMPSEQPGAIRIRVVEELHGEHIRSKTFYPGKTATFEGVCEMLIRMGFPPSANKEANSFVRKVFQKLRKDK